MAPVVHGLEDQYTGRMRFVYLDIDDPAAQPFKDALKYRVQPHFFLLDAQGNVLKQWLGFVDKAEFEAAFNAALGATTP
jgi:thioredoxin-related protein